MNRKTAIKVTVISLCLIILIIDSQTALNGANEGIALCITRIIPTLFPFCILSKIMCRLLLGRDLRILHCLGMPKGAESIFLISLVGGYPIGAQCVDDAYQCGAISEADAKRMLGFCNNAGPAFIFGVMCCLLPTLSPMFCLYVIHMLSAFLVGLILPHKSYCNGTIPPKSELNITKAVEESTKALAYICSWIILFKVLLAFLVRWLGWMLEAEVMVVIAGIIELSNGSIALLSLDSLGLRFILASLFLAAGGCCVALQTFSVTKHCGIGEYFKGKFLQCLISIFLATITQTILFEKTDTIANTSTILLISSFGIVIYTFILRRKKKVLAFAQ